MHDAQDSSHRIEDTVFDFAFPSERSAAGRQAEIGPFVRHRLLRVVDEVFDELSTPGNVVRIDRLEIDLGAIPEAHFEYELIRRLRERLRDVLSGRIHAGAGPPPGGSARVVSSERSDWERLEYFLRYGRLPWNADPRSRSEVAELAARTIANDASTLAAFLRRTAGLPHIVERLVSQLPTPALEALVEALAPSRAAGFLAASGTLLRSVASLTDADQRRRRENAVWVGLLNGLIASGPDFDPGALADGGRAPRSPGVSSLAMIRAYDLRARLSDAVIAGVTHRTPRSGALVEVIDELVREHPAQLIGLADALHGKAFAVAPSDALSLREWKAVVGALVGARRAMGEPVGELARAVDSFGSRAPDARVFYRRLFVELVAGGAIDLERAAAVEPQPGDSGPADFADGPAESEAERFDRLAGHLEHGAPIGAGSLDPEAWDRFLAKRRDGLRERLEPLLVQRAVVDRLVGVATDRVLTRLLERFRPVDHAAVQEAVDVLDELARNARMGIPAGQRRLAKWRTAFRYLFPPGRRFELGDFVSMFVDVLGAETSVSDLRARLQRESQRASRISGSAHRVKVAEDILRILGGDGSGSPADPRLRARGAGVRISPESAVLVRGYDLADRIRQALETGGRHRRSGSLAEGIEELAREHPHRLLALWSDLAGRTQGRPLEADLSAADWRALLMSFLAVRRDAGDAGSSRWIGAVGRFEARAPEAGRFYRRVLERLLAGQEVDIETIVRESAEDGGDRLRPSRHAQMETAAGGEPQPGESRAADFTDGLGEFEGKRFDRLAGHLEHGDPIGAGSLDPETWDRFLAKRRDWLRVRMEPLLVRGEVVDRLVGVAPDRVLTRLLERFRPVDHAAVQQAVDVLDDLARNARMGIPAGQRRLAKWRTAFRYLFPPGRRFELGDFVSMFVDVLGAETSVPDLRARLQLESQRASRISGSAHRVKVAEDILRILTIAPESAEDGGDAVPSAAGAQPDGSPDGDDDTARVRTFLEGSFAESPAPSVAARLAEGFERMLVHRPALLARWVEPHLSKPEFVDRLIDILPDRLLTRILYRLRPSGHAQMETAADLLIHLWRRVEPERSRGQLRRVRWTGIFRHASAQRLFSSESFVDAFVGRLAEASHASDRRRYRRTLAERAVLPASLSAPALEVARLLGIRDPRVTRPLPENDASTASDDGLLPAERIHIGNAGLVIAAPYLPTLFSRLELVVEGRFRSPAAAGRAIHLLQYMTNGSTETPEHQLVLNKILCGVPIASWVEPGIQIRDSERDTVDGLIRAMIERWSRIGSTSVDGFRQSFLERPGVLESRDSGWALEVEERSFDVLLDHIPWSFAIVKHSWMARAIHVKWRSR